MGNQVSPDRTVVPVQPTSERAETQRTAGNTTVTAQTGSFINTPHFTDVNFRGDAHLTTNVNITYVQPPDRSDGTNAVSPKTEGNIQRCQADLKSYLESETRDLIQGTKEDGPSTPLHKIYTELYITEGDSGEVNSEHETVELECKRSLSEEKKIDLNDIFQPLSNEENAPQRVLTKGIAGIGKTVAVQKFTRDWAEGKANQKTQFIFPLTFRELNLLEDKSWSLKELLGYFFREVKDLDTSDYNRSTVLFIFDGLDESKLPLDFKTNVMCRDITDTASLDGLLTNLIKGKLLHKASVWITSRPAAAKKIPSEFINRVTEVRGFNDEQKEEYFKKKVSDKSMAQQIISHLQSKPLRSLFIMCHIPVFSWISATVLQSLLTDARTGELPKTVTEMYTHFLIIQTKRKHEKDYQEGETDREVIMKLGKLAFEELQKGNVVFNENDLRSRDIDLKEAAVYSGVCTQIIRKEYGLHRQELYSFIHLSVQEFLAALYVLETFIDSGKNLLPSKSRVTVASERGDLPIILLHKNAVDMALASDYGQWDLFLRFLLGLSQDKNQKLLQRGFGFKGRCPLSDQQTIDYIHEKIRKLSYTDKSINLFHCLNELGDQSLVEQVQQFQNAGDVGKISPAHWSALAFLLLCSNEDLDVFDLRKYHRSDEVLERLLPVLRVSKTASLSDCNLTDRCSKHISSVLSSKSSGLKELDLSLNKLWDSGATQLSDGLKSPNSKLQKLCLKECSITTTGCQSLATSLASNRSHLRELDLSNNNLKDEGLKLLSEVLNNCSLETLRLCQCGFTESGCKPLASALSSNPSHLRNLDLSRNSLGGQGVAQLSDFLQHPDCKLERLWLFKTNLRKEGAAALASALASNPIHLRDLDLGGNVLGDDGVMEIAALLKNPDCRVNSLRLEGCRFTEVGCSVLVSSLRSNPAHLRVLDLTRNDLKDHGAENLCEFLAEPLCGLETLSLKCCSLTAACCRPLTLSCSSVLKELDLSYNQLMDQGVKLLSDWLRRPQCRLEVLRLSDCSDSSCESLASALMVNPSHLRELELSRTDPGGPGLSLLSDLQNNSRYKLETLTVKT